MERRKLLLAGVGITLGGCAEQSPVNLREAGWRIELKETPQTTQHAVSFSVSAVDEYATKSSPPKLRFELTNEGPQSQSVGLVGHGVPPTRRSTPNGLYLIPDEMTVEPVSSGTWIPKNENIVSEPTFSSISYKELDSNQTISADCGVWIDPVAETDSYEPGEYQFVSSNMPVLEDSHSLNPSFSLRVFRS